MWQSNKIFRTWYKLVLRTALIFDHEQSGLNPCKNSTNWKHIFCLMNLKHFPTTYMYFQGISADICLIISSAIFDNAKTGQIFAVRNILHTCYIKRDYLRAKPIMHAPNTFHPLGIYPQIMIWKLSRGVQIRKPLLRTVSGQIGDRSPCVKQLFSSLVTYQPTILGVVIRRRAINTLRHYHHYYRHF